jgi:hypothetical protein
MSTEVSVNTITTLKALCKTDTGPYLRPFAPNQDWNQAKIFIVGTNPATPLRNEFRDFDDYWFSLTSNVANFESIYSKRHLSGASKTTLRARKVIVALDPLPVLVTNSIAHPTSRMSKLTNLPHHREIGSQCFELLVTLNQPKVILFHGKEACNLCARVFGVVLDRYMPISNQISQSDSGIGLYGFPHFCGVGVKKGYSVAGMNEELRVFSDIAKDIIS